MARITEVLFRWVPGHAERVAKREELGYTGINKVTDILTFGGLARAREQGRRDGRRFLLEIHNKLWDVLHHNE